MNGALLKYNFSNFALMAQDIERRNSYYKKTVALLNRKAELDINYAGLIDSFRPKQKQPQNTTKSVSQCLYEKMFDILQGESQRMKQIGQMMKVQADKMGSFIEYQSVELKKLLENAQKITKQIQSQRQKLERSKTKYDKKSEELQYSKIKYLSSVIGTEQLQKINDLYLEVNGLEESIKPLFQDYKQIQNKFHQSVQKMVEEFNVILKRLQQTEGRKIKNIKFAVSKYVRLTKLNLDQVMEEYPFLCQKIDSMREREEFIPHSEQSLIMEGKRLETFNLRQSDYIDSIYERIERKKNLEEIILYGQNIEHKKNLTSSFLQNGNNALFEDINEKTVKMVDIFKAVFNGSSTTEMINELKQLFKGDEKLRKDFILCLQQFRINNAFELNLRSKQCITSCLLAFLDVCHSQLDTYNSKMLMVLSLTYHFSEEKGKVELQELIRDHQIWKKINWWQAALLETIYEETRVKSKLKEVAVKIWDIKAGGICRKEEGEQQTYQNICFNQILFFVRNMSIFNIDSEQILQYAKLNINALKFSGKLAKDILDLCPKTDSPSPPKTPKRKSPRTP